MARTMLVSMSLCLWQLLLTKLASVEKKIKESEHFNRTNLTKQENKHMKKPNLSVFSLSVTTFIFHVHCASAALLSGSISIDIDHGANGAPAFTSDGVNEGAGGGDGLYAIGAYGFGSEYLPYTSTGIFTGSAPHLDFTTFYVPTPENDPASTGYASAYFVSGLDKTTMAVANGISSVSQITSASVYGFSAGNINLGSGDSAITGVEANVGDFLILYDADIGYYAALQLTSSRVYNDGDGFGNFNWWLQTDGTGDFSAVPESGQYGLFSGGLLALLEVALLRRRYKKLLA
jgi:hypothetical protein